MKNRPANSLFFYFIISILIIITSASYGQEVIIQGKITDSETGELMPFVTISVLKTPYKTDSDEDGNYVLKARLQGKDTLLVTYIGYNKKKIAIKHRNDPHQTIDIKLEPDGSMMQEIVVTVKENPAWAILRKVVVNKNKNDKTNLKAYEYDCYSKMQLYMDDIKEKSQRKKYMREIRKALDTVKIEKAEDGDYMLPILFSETISKCYYDNVLKTYKEEVYVNKSNNIGLNNGRLIKPMISSTYQEANFYKNRITIQRKDFLSPLNDGWQVFYEYDLVDTVVIDNNVCYQINFQPKVIGDLAFSGTIWITDTSYALKQIHAKTNKGINLNFVEKIEITQRLSLTEDSAWLPSYTCIMMDLSKITSFNFGAVVKNTMIAKNFVVNKRRPRKFFDVTTDEMSDAYDRDNEMDELRFDSLEAGEKNFNKNLDVIKNVPIMKNYIKLANLLTVGYWRTGWIETGHYAYMVNVNNVEGVRIAPGVRTTINFSRKWFIKGQIGYGTKDQVFKYNASVDYIFSRRPWTVLSFESKYDLDQFGVNFEYLLGTDVLRIFTKNGTMRGPFYHRINSVFFQTDLSKGVIQRVTFRTRAFDPAYPFEFYRPDGSLGSFYRVTEAQLDTRLSKNEKFVIFENQRYGVGFNKFPIVSIRNTFGIKNLFGGEFNYYKLGMMVSHNFTLGALGRSYYDFSAGKIFSNTPIPYTLLESHLGNQTFFYSNAAFSLMNYFEFISDTYVTIKYRHFFEGLFFNRIPLIKKLKWGTLATVSMAYGGMSTANYNLTPDFNKEGQSLKNFHYFKDIPYIEVGYGITHILKFLRVDFVHRLTYLDNPNINKFGVRISALIEI